MVAHAARLAVAAAALAAVLVTPARSSGPASAQNAVISVPGTAVALSADGNRVAVVYEFDQGKERCRALVVWTPPSTKLIHPRGGKACGIGSSDLGDELRLEGVTLAGKRLAWTDTSVIEDYPGPQGDEPVEICIPETGPLAGPIVELKKACELPYEGAEFAGDGSTLVVSTFVTESDRYSEAQPRLWRVVGRRLVPLSRAGDYRAVAVDAGHVLAGPCLGCENLRSTDKSKEVVLFSKSGKQLRKIALTARDAFRGGFLSGDLIALGLKGSLEVYRASGGPRLRSYHLKGTPYDLDGGLLVLGSGGAVRALRVTDGRGRALVTGIRGLVGAQLEPGGLFYAFNAASGARRGHVGFVPHSAVMARFG